MHDFKSLFFYWQPVENHIYFNKFVIKILKLNANIYKLAENSGQLFFYY